MRRSPFSILAVTAMLAMVTACSESPLSPSSAVSGPFDAQRTALYSDGLPLRWDLVAPGCSPSTPPSPLPDSDMARVHSHDPGVKVATWDWSYPAGRPAMLQAQFVRTGEIWALCYWDTSDL